MLPSSYGLGEDICGHRSHHLSRWADKGDFCGNRRQQDKRRVPALVTPLPKPPVQVHPAWAPAPHSRMRLPSKPSWECHSYQFHLSTPQSCLFAADSRTKLPSSFWKSLLEGTYENYVAPANNFKKHQYPPKAHPLCCIELNIEHECNCLTCSECFPIFKSLNVLGVSTRLAWKQSILLPRQALATEPNGLKSSRQAAWSWEDNWLMSMCTLELLLLVFCSVDCCCKLARLFHSVFFGPSSQSVGTGVHAWLGH